MNRPPPPPPGPDRPWLQYPPERDKYLPGYDNEPLYSGLTLWQIVAIILGIVVFVIIVMLVLTLLIRYGCRFCCRCRGGGGESEGYCCGCRQDWCAWLWCGGCCRGCCRPYQPYRGGRGAPTSYIEKRSVYEDGFRGGGGGGMKSRYNNGSSGTTERVIVIKDEIKERPESVRRTVIQRQQLVNGAYDDDDNDDISSSRDVVAVVHRGDYDDDYDGRPTAVAHMSVDRGGSGYPAGGDIGGGYHSAAYDVETIRYPSLQSIR